VEAQFNMEEFSKGCGDAVAAVLQSYGAADWEALEGMVSEEMMAVMQAQHRALASTGKFEVGCWPPGAAGLGCCCCCRRALPAA
jgi:predicted lipid-binding transport protein (Tim44 family)